MAVLYQSTLHTIHHSSNHLGHYVQECHLVCTVEPPNKGHIGTSHFVLRWEVVLFSEVKNELLLWERGPELRPLLGSCPYLGGSFIGGSTVSASWSNQFLLSVQGFYSLSFHTTYSILDDQLLLSVVYIFEIPSFLDFFTNLSSYTLICDLTLLVGWPFFSTEV